MGHFRVRYPGNTDARTYRVWEASAPIERSAAAVRVRRNVAGAASWTQ